VAVTKKKHDYISLEAVKNMYLQQFLKG